LTHFEVSQLTEGIGAAGSLSIKEIWDLNYRLRSAPGVFDANRCLACRCQWILSKTGEFSPERVLHLSECRPSESG